MKKYALVKCYPVGYGSSNQTIADCSASSFDIAVNTLQRYVQSVTLNKNGYAKEGVYTWVVCAVYEPFV